LSFADVSVAVTDILEKWGDVFYPNGPTKAAHTENYSQQKAAQQRCYGRCEGRHGTHNPIDPYDVFMMYQFKAIEPEKVRAYLKGCEEVAAAQEHKGLEEKVNSWKESLAPLTILILTSGSHAAHKPANE